MLRPALIVLLLVGSGVYAGAVLNPLPAISGDVRLSVWRGQFQQARAALQRGDETTFLRLERGLQAYPLAGYLRFAWLSSRLDTTPDAELEEFLRTERDSPVSGRLRTAWLKSLAKRQRWQQFLKVYAGKQSTTLRCNKLSAELAMLKGTKLSKRLKQEFESLWLVGRSQPKACDKPFTQVERQGALSDALRWRRIALAMQQGQTRLAEYLRRSLADKGLQRWVDRWIEMRKDPATVLDGGRWPDRVEARTVLVYGVKRLAGEDAELADARWQDLSGRFAFDAGERISVAADIAVHAALQQLPEARLWLAALTDPGERERAWAVRAALAELDWQGVLDGYGRLSAKQQLSDQWRYWQARALSALGKERAKGIFADLASRRGYHSFLAADHLGQPYLLKDQAPAVDAAEIRKVASLPGIRRARELMLLLRGWEARVEWARATAGLSTKSLRAATQLAQGWGWYDRALATATKAGDYDALALRFPLAYRNEVGVQANRHGLDRSWVFALIRQESAFIPDAGSPAGALGLMQVMPATGRETARRLGLRLRNAAQLQQGGLNIQIGSAYLKRVLNRFGGNQVLATAAYNAGPNKVSRWLPPQPLDATLWVETITYKETRRYVKSVLAYASIYDWRRGVPITRLTQRMPMIQARVK